VTIGFGRFVRILREPIGNGRKGTISFHCVTKLGLCRLEELFYSSFLHITCELFYYWLCWPFNNETKLLALQTNPRFSLWGWGCFSMAFL
jgi:hypothetical protein